MENTATDKQFVPGGAFLIARKSFESDLWRNKPMAWWRIFQYIIGHVQHKDFKELKRGQGYFNFSELAREKAFGRGVSANSVEHCLLHLRKAESITSKKATWGTLVTVLNYNLYQDLNNYESGTESVSKSGVEAEPKRKYKQEWENDKNVNRPSLAQLIKPKDVPDNLWAKAYEQISERFSRGERISSWQKKVELRAGDLLKEAGAKSLEPVIYPNKTKARLYGK